MGQSETSHSATDQSAVGSASLEPTYEPVEPSQGNPIIFRYTGEENKVIVIGGDDNSSSSSDGESKGRVSPPNNVSQLTGKQEGADLEAKSASSTVSSDEFEPYNNQSVVSSVTESEFNPIVNSTLSHETESTHESDQLQNPLFNDSYQDLKRAENLLAFRYADQLKQLTNMGFPNEEFNIDLLQKHGGEVYPVI